MVIEQPRKSDRGSMFALVETSFKSMRAATEGRKVSLREFGAGGFSYLSLPQEPKALKIESTSARLCTTGPGLKRAEYFNGV